MTKRRGEITDLKRVRLALTLCLSLFSSVAGAQDLQQFLPASGDWNYLSLDGTTLAPEGQWTLTNYIHYGRNPLLLIAPNGAVKEVIIRYLTTNDLNAVLGIHERVEVGVALPYTFSSGIQSEENYPVDDGDGVGDIRLNAKVLLVKPEDLSNVGIAVGWMNSLPTGDIDREGSNRDFTSTLKLISEYHHDKFRASLNIGYRWRPANRVLNELDSSSAFIWGLGAGVPFMERFEFVSEIYQRIMTFNRSPLEALVAVRVKGKGPFSVTLGGGSGVGGDYSSVEMRILGALTYTPSAEPERPIPYQAMPPPDADHDGILDSFDRCPTEPEDRDGLMDGDGCPEDDADQDGILDVKDSCPTQAEDKDQFKDEDGCPELDNDGDGLIDAVDRCPNKPEVINQYKDEDGCPDELPKTVEEGQLLDVSEKVFFAHNKAEILKRSHSVLKQVSDFMRRYPEINKLRVEGHTDDTGGREANHELSQARADAVRLHLISLGVEVSRLESRGYGDKQPIASNDTDEGRALNRRVNFRILDGPQEIFSVKADSSSSTDQPEDLKTTTPELDEPAALKEGPRRPEAQSRKVSKKVYGIQVNASYNLAQAEKIRLSLIADRFPAYILSVKRDNGQLIHRVRLGPYWGKNSALEAKAVYLSRFPKQRGLYLIRISKKEAKEAKKR